MCRGVPATKTDELKQRTNMAVEALNSRYSEAYMGRSQIFLDICRPTKAVDMEMY
jgi:hypothetical protein